MLYTAKESFQFNRRGIRINPGDVIELSDEELKDFANHPKAFELLPGQKRIGRPPNATTPAANATSDAPPAGTETESKKD